MKNAFPIKCIYFVLLMNYPCSAIAQTIQQMEVALNQHLKRIEHFAYLSHRTDETAYDSLVLENIYFEEKLLLFANNNPEILTYEFPLLRNENFNIATSSDRKFRIFSWDLQTGGTMHFYDNVFVYAHNKKIVAYSPELPEGSPGGYYSDIYQFRNDENAFYLAYQHRTLSNRDLHQEFQIYSFEKDSLIENHKKILTKAGFTSKLGFPFNFYSVVDKNERPIRLIKYNNALQTITLPVVTENGDVTKKKIVYQYNGHYFTKQQ
ncbi:MAG: hypothetical protein IPO02_04325 [Bacteroidetes bacterium]|nr:hypothetical protein [Bacteroidota bacterium]